MALSRRPTRFPASIWPGFVDAMTALILVLFFVLSVFMIVQFVLRDTISGQGRELEELSVQVANLADALGLERSRADRGEALVATLTAERDAAQNRITVLEGEAEEAAARIGGFEEQVSALIAQNTDLEGSLEAAQTESAERLEASEALEAALAQARTELDAEAEVARLAAARTDALQALVGSLRGDLAELSSQADQTSAALSESEATRLAEAAAAEALRERLANADAELTAMTLNLEAARQRAEDTLLKLAAAEAAQERLEGDQETALSAAERSAAELAQARALLSEEEEISAAAQREVALLNQQTAELRGQLDALQGLLDTAEARDIEARVQIEKLGANLNAALAQVAAEERARAELEARERERLEAEAEDLERYRSEFFGRMREILGEREGVRVVGDRFVFSSEVLFPPGSAVLGVEGREQVARVAEVITDIAGDIPAGIDWILRVDGHTDRVPVGAGRPFRDNWELSQARALSVVRYMIEEQDLPPDRLAATGFGEFQPVDNGDTPEALARNRRIELKLTER